MYQLLYNFFFNFFFFLPLFFPLQYGCLSLLLIRFVTKLVICGCCRIFGLDLLGSCWILYIYLIKFISCKVICHKQRGKSMAFEGVFYRFFFVFFLLFLLSFILIILYLLDVFLPYFLLVSHYIILIFSR